MKDERNVRRRRATGRKWKPAAILLAAVLMVISVPFGSRAVRAVDLSQNCSLTVTPGNSTLTEDLGEANVVIDLYRVADAAEVPGYDTYTWTMTEPFSSITIDAEVDSAGWAQAAQQAAEIVLGTAPDGETEWDPSSTVEAIDASLKVPYNAPNEAITELPAGLYLVLARSSDLTEYAGTVTDETEATEKTVTIAKSGRYKYSFSPELVSLPSKEADESGVINTANPGAWVYDAEITLKPLQEINVGPLVITKHLVDYAQREKENRADDLDSIIKDPATFVFKVVVYDSKESADKEDQDAIVYQDYVSIVFDSYGSKSVQIDNLPVDSYAVVTEEYSGRVYSVTVDPETTTIVAEDDEDAPASVEFTNTNTGQENGGGSVTNKFQYDESNTEWGWQHVTDDSTDGEVLNENK